MSKVRYTFDENQITAHLVDGHYEWIAFKGSNNVCKLIKSSIFDPTRILYEILITGDKIVKIKKNGNHIFLALEDAIYLGARITRQNPLGTTLYYARQSGMAEYPVDLAIGTYVYFLIPGAISGEYATLLKYNKVNNILQETIELDIGGENLRNASSIDINTTTQVMIAVTNESPIKLGKIYYDTQWNLITWLIE